MPAGPAGAAEPTSALDRIAKIHRGAAGQAFGDSLANRYGIAGMHADSALAIEFKELLRSGLYPGKFMDYLGYSLSPPLFMNIIGYIHGEAL